MADKEYIERGALIENIKRVYCADCNSYDGVRCRACGTGDALDMIDDAPTADVAPRAEVAREIFEEIDSLIYKWHSYSLYSTGELLYDVAELKKKHTQPEPPEGD